MYLEEVILEGFKSYANRTVIGLFHPQFNAISGLNGTGKSNILDGICFVMGIKSLAQKILAKLASLNTVVYNPLDLLCLFDMRVSKVEELIYKQGQAGISKASVTLIFRNDERRSSPIGMSDIPKITITRQIAVGGRERYIMNGHHVRATDIQTVFQSVQLNVNHPHFLVAQGRITKVINMKPREILGLIEESAGTRLYELKRSESSRRIAVKETKLQEIDNLVHNEIEPAIQELRKKQEQYTQSLLLAEEIVCLEKRCHVYEYLRLSAELEETNKCCDEKNKLMEDMSLEVQKAKEQLEALNENLSCETQNHSELTKTAKELKNQETKLNQELAVHRVERKLLGEDRMKVEEEIKALERKINEAKRELGDVKNRGDKALKEEEEKTRELERLHQEMDDWRALIEEARTGSVTSTLVHSEGQSPKQRQTVEEKLVETELRLKNIQGEIQTLKLSIRKWEEEIKLINDLGQLEESQKVTKTLEQQIQETKKRLEDLAMEKKFGVTIAEDLAKCEREIHATRIKINEMEDTLTLLNRELYPITRVYEENPQASEEGIEGVAAELFRLKDQHVRYAVALEEAGKGRLFNIVVENDDMAKRLLEKYKSLRRITCLPLNRIQCRSISQEALEAAQKVAELPLETTDLLRPIDTLWCDAPQYLPALTFVFGQAFLCATHEIAQKISTHPCVKGIGITLEGDYYNPLGSVSGGSQTGLNGLLMKLEKLHSARDALKTVTKQLCVLESERKNLLNKRSEYEKMEMESDQLQWTLNNLTRRLENEENIKMVSSLSHLKDKRDQALAKLSTLETDVVPNLRDVILPQLRQQKQALQGSEASRRQHIEECQQKIQQCKKKASAVEAFLKKTQQSNNTCRGKISDLQERIGLNEAQLQNMSLHEVPRLIDAEKQAAACELEKENQLTDLQTKIKEVERRMEKEKSSRIHLNDTQQALDSFVSETHVKLTKLRHELGVEKKKWGDLCKRRCAIIREHGWVVKEAETFLQQGRAEELHERECFVQLEALKRKYDTKKKTCKNLMAILELSERELKELKEKRTQLIRDKQKLEEFIEELDRKKKSVLEGCWKQVDEFFSSIFSSLLPSCNAHLYLTPTGNIDDGLEMKVTLAGVTKNSLGELSGGQRSLVALALILSLLKHKPAPFYILDEIDAALDISHTQRIGLMIRTQFAHSQFLIVSLKENLFNYANVLFKTHFQNGTSCVTRIVNESFHPKKRKNETHQQEHHALV